MVAVDQRESLRVMMGQALGQPASDGDMRDFKAAVAHTLSGEASGLLVDPLYGLEAVSTPEGRCSSCGLIVSVDDIQYDEGGTAIRSDVNLAFGAARRQQAGAVALKFLLIWSKDGWLGANPAALRDFVAHCREHELLSLVETVVREPDGSKPADGRRHAELLIEAALEIGPFEPDLYKTEVPYLNKAPAEKIVACSERLTRDLPCPWVVLSSGVDAADFPTAVRLACDGGASGFLAGRGIWGPALGTEVEKRLRDFSLQRLRELRGIADAAVSARAMGERGERAS
jgi:sulfofructosephosphate aldolase